MWTVEKNTTCKSMLDSQQVAAAPGIVELYAPTAMATMQHCSLTPQAAHVSCDIIGVTANVFSEMRLNA